MRQHLFWMASFLAIEMGGCTTFRPPPLEPAKACADWRWIGISRSGAQCPDVPGWTVRPLFPQLAPVRQTSEDFCAREEARTGDDREEDKKSKKGDYCEEKNSEKVPSPELIRELNRFCVYEVASKWLKHRPFPAAASAELVRLDQDCAALSTSGAADLKAKIWGAPFELLREQVGLPGQPLAIVHPFGVRLAFLDTEPTHGEIRENRAPRNSLHGYTLAHIARHLVCPGESCAARITTQLALPMTYFDAKSQKLTMPDPDRGGFLGMQSDLAKAIQSEVIAWQENRRGSSEQHLVLNLSLAWDGELFDGLDAEQVDEMRAGTQAVYRALQYAAGFDALVLAAAGNQRGEPCADFGPLLPAAWETRGPREESCCEHQKTSPLVYAVGGLDSAGHRLVNARRGGMPWRAAYGDNAVVSSFDPDEPTAILTGSSAATAVASAIAAVVWDYFPDLTSSQVMQILDESGEDLSLPADFGFTSDRPMIHRLSLCTALTAACNSRLIRSVSRNPDPCPIECDALRRRTMTPPSLSKHEKWVPNSCQPWLHPQPESPPCLGCAGGPPGS